MSIFEQRKKLSEMPADQVYVIYGEQASGKTVLASTFPKPMLFLDINEGGTDSIPHEYEDEIEVISIRNFNDFDEAVTTLLDGHYFDSTGTEVKLPEYKSVAFDTITQLEYLLKQMVMKENSKSSMTLQLWGKTKDTSEFMFQLFREIHEKTSACVIATAHVKAIKKEEHPEYDILLPSMMESAARTLCAKASHVWFTDVVYEDTIDPTTSEVTRKVKFVTTIDRVPYLVTKCRKPPTMTGKIPLKITNLTYNRFQKMVLDQITKED